MTIEVPFPDTPRPVTFDPDTVHGTAIDLSVLSDMLQERRYGGWDVILDNAVAYLRHYEQILRVANVEEVVIGDPDTTQTETGR